MSISDLFTPTFRKRNEDHFAAIVAVAMTDGVITKEEKSFLDRLAKNLGIKGKKYQKILEEYKSHPINPPASYQHRLERLYDLSRMVYADDTLGKKQTSLLTKLSIGLGFPLDSVNHVVEEALKLVQKNVDIDTFSEAIKKIDG